MLGSKYCGWCGKYNKGDWVVSGMCVDCLGKDLENDYHMGGIKGRCRVCEEIKYKAKGIVKKIWVCDDCSVGGV